MVHDFTFSVRVDVNDHAYGIVVLSGGWDRGCVARLGRGADGVTGWRPDFSGATSAKRRSGRGGTKTQAAAPRARSEWSRRVDVGHIPVSRLFPGRQKFRIVDAVRDFSLSDKRGRQDPRALAAAPSGGGIERRVRFL